MIGKHTRNTAQTEPADTQTFNEEDKDLEELPEEKDFLLQIAALESGDRKTVRQNQLKKEKEREAKLNNTKRNLEDKINGPTLDKIGVSDTFTHE